MDIYDKFYQADPAILRSNGEIVQCLDTMIGGFQVSIQMFLLLFNPSKCSRIPLRIPFPSSQISFWLHLSIA